MDPNPDPLAAPEAEPRPAINPGAPAIVGFLLIALGLGGFLSWATMVELASGAVASGRVIVDSRRQTVQHLEGGILRDIMVRDGDRVAAGAVVARLDATVAKARADQIQTRLDGARIRLARLAAEREGAPAMVPPPDIVQLATRVGDQRVAALISAEADELTARRAQLSEREAILEKRGAQLAEQISGVEALITAKTRQLELSRAELADRRKLWEKRLMRRSELLANETRVAGLEGEIGSHRAEIARARAAISESQSQILELRASARAQVLAEIDETQKERFSLEEELKAALDTLERTEIRAPVAGEVVDRRIHTEGATLEPNGVLLDIVPSDDEITIEAEVEPTDIDSVAPGTLAEVRFPAFDQSDAPIVFGRVRTISADTRDDPRAERSYYVAEVALNEEAVAALADMELTPGMPAEILLRTGERTVWDYLTSPLTDIFRKAFREI